MKCIKEWKRGYIPYAKDLTMKICNGLRPKIPFYAPKLITRGVGMLEENKYSKIVIQIKKAEEFRQIKITLQLQLLLIIKNIDFLIIQNFKA
ncbi:hypothetical protein Glove_640g23 [Diversispora epigaea]|uniref:Uncharacterized protein n=1 Tax=Diversispora epigaea TaxID=1348612 RepID=A0A397G7Z0_9GLOM|nr:hypothetical protein Glove_640g23 [Diversispora epigaea]